MPRPAHPHPPALPILVVEDDQATREYLVLLLALEGYATVEAASGAATLATVATQPLQAVLLDLRLPDLDGFTVCRQLRALGHGALPILLITADHAPQLERQAADVGVSGVLRKPFEPAEVLTALAAIGARSVGGAAGGRPAGA
jgi:two-component system response regulator MprA